MIVNAESPDQPEVLALLERLDAFCAALYPAESNHLIGVQALQSDGVLFLVARDVDGSAAGCAALVNCGGYGEVKRMFVDERKRGMGAARRLLEQIATFARMSGLGLLRLETGVRQLEAISLYERFGFSRCEPFGDYAPDPLSVFMEMRL
jgi:putative acetyltransferase